MLKQESRCSVYCYASAAAGRNLQDLDNFFPAPVRNFNLLELKVLSKFSDDKFNIRVNSEVLCVFSKSVYCRNLETYRRFEIIRAPEKEISEVFIVLDIGESVPEQKTVKKSFEAFVFFGNSFDAPKTESRGTSTISLPLWYLRSFRIVKRLFRIALLALKISSSKATCAVGDSRRFSGGTRLLQGLLRRADQIFLPGLRSWSGDN